MTWVRDEALISSYESELQDWEDKKTEWEDDYAILVDQELVLAQLYTVCENSISLTGVLDVSIDSMVELSKEVDVTSFDQLFDFSDLNSGGALMSQFKQANEDAQDAFKTAGDKIDELKVQLSTKINEAVEEIYRINEILNNLRVSYHIWVEDE